MNERAASGSLFVVLGILAFLVILICLIGEQKGELTIEHRYIGDIVEGLEDAGFQDKVDFWIYF